MTRALQCDLSDTPTPLRVVGADETVAAPWERQEGESLRGYEAFLVYRELPPSQRSIPESARVFYAQGSPDELKNFVPNRGQVSTMEGWSRSFGWQARTAAWVTERDRVRRLAAVEDIEQMEKRHIAIAQRLLGKAYETLQNIRVSAAELNAASRAIAEAVRVERITRGLPAEVTASSLLLAGPIDDQAALQRKARDEAAMADPAVAFAAEEYLVRLREHEQRTGVNGA